MDIKTRHAAQRLCRIIPAVLSLIVLNCCAPKAAVKMAPPAAAPEFENRTAEAEALFKKGCYVGFKKAIEIYQGLYAQRAIKNRVLVPYVKALILMSVRQKELGLLDDTYIQRARDLIKDSSSLRVFAPYVDLADAMSPKTRGIMRDINVVGTVKVVADVLKNVQLKDDMKLKAQAEDYYAYLYVTFFTSYANYLDQKEELSSFTKLYPDSILFKYKNATADLREDPKLLEALAGADPEFYEAYYHLGELALKAQNLVEAEKNFLKALEGIPESPQVTIYLGSIYMATEEFEKSLEYYEKTIALAPSYRDALLGKAICLSSMGKYQEAIEVLNKLVAMGFYLMGESHYWLAWIYHELKDNENAQLNIEESKGRLPTNNEVFSLAGTIAFEKNEFDKAEKEFLESCKYGGNTEALFGLGKVYAQKQKWLDSGLFFQQATVAVGQSQTLMTERIRQIKASSLSEERKARMIAKKEQQLKVLEATKATGYYDAAAGYLNAGRRTEALAMAEKAAAHPQFKDLADQLIKKIK
jgi:tetratricopeptide (TPR) repeat protein